MRVICLLIQDGRFLHEIAEACYRLTPQVAIRENEAVFLEISRCGKIYSEDNLLLRLQALLKRFNVRARVAVADDCALSLCFARTNFKGYPPDRLSSARLSSARLPIEVLHDIASPFERDDLVFKQVEELIGVLKRLGIYDLGGFLALPVKSLASRFHSLGLILHHKLTAPDSHLSWPPFIPTEKIEEDAVIQDSENAHELEPLLFVIKNLAGRAMARLAGGGGSG